MEKTKDNQGRQVVTLNGGVFATKTITRSGSTLDVRRKDNNSVHSFSKEQLREFIAVAQHWLDHGTLYAEPRPIRRVRAKRKSDGQEMEGIDDETNFRQYAMYYRDEDGKVVILPMDPNDLTDITTIEG